MELDVDPRLFFVDPDELVNRDNNKSGPRHTVFIAGCPGCGKTTATQDYILQYLPKDTIVYLFSAQNAERSLNLPGHTIRKMKLDPDILSRINKEVIRADAKGHNIVCVFDDIDAFTGKTYKAIQTLMEDLLANGRSHSNKEQHIHMIITSHALNDYHRTKRTLENCEYIVVFPSHTKSRQLELLLTKCGMGKEEIELVKSLPSRRVLYKTHYPQQLIKF